MNKKRKHEIASSKPAHMQCCNIPEMPKETKSTADGYVYGQCNPWYPGKPSDITPNAKQILKTYCKDHNIGKDEVAIQEDLMGLKITDIVQQVEKDLPCEIFEILDPSNPVKRAAENPFDCVYGVRATRSIKRNSAVCEYTGKIMTTEEYQIECSSVLWIDKQPSRLYAFDVLNQKLVVDASPAIGDYGPGGRINDAPGPNDDKTRHANVIYVECIIQHRVRILVIAKRDIAVGEEILACYGSDYWAGYKTVQRETSSIQAKINSVYKHCENEVKNLKTVIQRYARKNQELSQLLLSREKEIMKLSSKKTSSVSQNALLKTMKT